jgi:polyhydroxybutyrate depolymerase
MLTIDHGGHVEPSLRYHYGPIYSQLVGPQNRDLESAEEAWSFFRKKVAP